MGKTYWVQSVRQPDKARPYFEEAIRLKPDAPEPHFNFGSLLQKEGKLDEAIEQYRLAIANRPDFADAQNNLGVVLASQEKYAEAIPYFEAAAKLEPAIRPQSPWRWRIGRSVARTTPGGCCASSSPSNPARTLSRAARAGEMRRAEFRKEPGCAADARKNPAASPLGSPVFRRRSLLRNQRHEPVEVLRRDLAAEGHVLALLGDAEGVGEVEHEVSHFSSS